MKMILLVGLVALAMLVGALAVPVLAHGVEDERADLASHEAWEAMYEACANGDWDAMAEAAEELHEVYYGQFPCHRDGYYAPNDTTQTTASAWRDTGGHMGSGMMHGGWRGMMGWR